MPPRINSGAGFAVACRIKEVREELRMTQETFAETMGVKRSHVADVETLRSEPSLDLIVGMLTFDLLLPGQVKAVNPSYLFLGGKEGGPLLIDRPRDVIKKWSAMSMQQRGMEVLSLRGTFNRLDDE